MFATGDCCVCHRLCTFNPELVPSIRVNGEREPVCADCIASANPKRQAAGLPPFVVLPGAYEPMECV
jgi:hypothetical protein